MDTLTYNDIKRFARPYTIKRLQMKHKRMFSQEGRIWADGFMLIMNCSDALEKCRTEESRSLAGDARLIVERAQPTRRIYPTGTRVLEKMYSTDLGLRLVEFTTDDGTQKYFDGRYLRHLWDMCPDGEFYLSENNDMLLLYTPNGELVGLLMRYQLEGHK